MSTTPPLYYFNDKIANRSYCCLSLKMGVLTDALMHLWTFYLFNIVFSNIAVEEIIPPVDLKFYQFTIPNVNNIFNVLDIIEIVMYMLGIIGCFKKSHKIMGYYKNYLWFECAMILFDHIMVTADSSNFKFPKDKLPDGADPAIAQMVVMVLFAFSLAIEMLLFAQSVYAAFVATWYERFLKGTSDQAEIKERKA